MRDVLIVGGPHDGKWYAAGDDIKTITLPNQPDADEKITDYNNIPSQAVVTLTVTPYMIANFRADHLDFWLAHLPSWSIGQAVYMLFRGYRRP